MCVKNHLNKMTSSLLCLYLPTSNLNKRGIKYQLTALNAFQKNVLIRSPIYDTFIPLKKNNYKKIMRFILVAKFGLNRIWSFVLEDKHNNRYHVDSLWLLYNSLRAIIQYWIVLYDIKWFRTVNANTLLLSPLAL